MTRRRLTTWLAVGFVVLLVAGGGLLLRQVVYAPRTFEAIFTSATGIYPGDEVRVWRSDPSTRSPPRAPTPGWC